MTLIERILAIEVGNGWRLEAADVGEGYAWCDDPSCAEWGDPYEYPFWNHIHPRCPDSAPACNGKCKPGSSPRIPLPHVIADRGCPRHGDP